MNQESSSATGRCPYPDCGATVNLGKKVCKTCGRPILGVASQPLVAEQTPAPAESLAEPRPPESWEPDPGVGAPVPPPTVEAPPRSAVVDAPPPPPTVE